MPFAKPVHSQQKVNLKELETNEDFGLSKEEAIARTEKIMAEVGELQELLFADGKTGLLIVLQGRDTSGKDGTIRFLLGHMNAQSTRVEPFKVPTPKELSHDFLWRVHQKAPGRGETVVFNRSHYEDVLVVRVHNLVPEAVWKKRFAAISHFESLLTDSNIIVLKFFLNISADEQKQRLLDREVDTTKAWKLNVRDWKEREHWDAYTAAYEDAISKCSSESAPWFIVPADKKWVRNLVIAEAILEALQPYRKQWMENLEELGETMRAELAEFRKTTYEEL